MESPSSQQIWRGILTKHYNDLRKDKTTFDIIDAQSIQNADTAEEKGYDAGKKVSGIKRHIVVDTMGLPHEIIITTANVTDRNGAINYINLLCYQNDGLWKEHLLG